MNPYWFIENNLKNLNRKNGNKLQPNNNMFFRNYQDNSYEQRPQVYNLKAKSNWQLLKFNENYRKRTLTTMTQLNISLKSNSSSKISNHAISITVLVLQQRPFLRRLSSSVSSSISFLKKSTLQRTRR